MTGPYVGKKEKKIHRNRGSVKQISMASLAHQIRRYLWGGKKSLTQWKQPQVSLRIPGLISDPCVIKKIPILVIITVCDEKDRILHQNHAR
jgi:hypothetical protein